MVRHLLELSDASGLTDEWITSKAKVGRNFLGRLRRGGTHDAPSVERVAKALGFEIAFNPIADSRAEAERAAAPKTSVLHDFVMTPEQRTDWRNLKSKRFTGPEAASMLGLSTGASA